MLPRIEVNGRLVDEITSSEGQAHYYEHLNYIRTWTRSINKRILPTTKEADEYLRLKAENPSCLGDLEMRKKYNKLNMYDNRYDWRPQKSGSDGFYGIVAPTGEQLLPEMFVDVFTEFDAINKKSDFVPVFNGEAWALVSLSTPPVIMTDFIYNAIIPERWGRSLFFVQCKKTMKWGVISINCPMLNINRRFKDRLAGVTILMPPVADEIYEDELMTEEAPISIFMTRIENKVGILTDFGYSDIIYDTYETDDDKMTFRLIRNDRKQAKRADYWHPDGKDLFVNLHRRMKKLNNLRE